MAKKKPTTAGIVNALVARAADALRSSALLSTGSTMLNLALTNNAAGGFAKGKYFWMVGDSSSGKTFLMLTCLAEASINPNFNDYRFIYDNVEDGALMDMGRYFGARMAARLESPAVDADGQPVYSSSIEDFYDNLDAALDVGPCVYLLDSMDALSSAYEVSKYDEAQKARRKGTTAKGSYGDGKAKTNSTTLRRVVGRLKESGSILIILSQTRDNLDAGMFDPQQVAAGGRALKFYATAQLWASVGSTIKRSIKGRDIKVGAHVRLTIKKNRLTGKDRTVTVPLYYSVGIDDVGGIVDFMCQWGVWSKKKSGHVILPDDQAAALGLGAGTGYGREELVQHLASSQHYSAVQDMAETAWYDIEDKLMVERASRYE